MPPTSTPSGTETTPADPGQPADPPPSSPAPTIVYPQAEPTKFKKTTTYTFSGFNFSISDEQDDSHKFPTIIKSGGCGCGGGCGGAKKAEAPGAAAPAIDLMGLLKTVLAQLPPDMIQRLYELWARFAAGGPSEH